MCKKILVISASMRRNSNSEAVADAFIKGAESAGNEVEKIMLSDKEIGFCRGCLACQSIKKCVINDDAIIITDKMEHADVIVFATPIYYYEMSGQLKTLLDRANSLFVSDYKFRDVYFISSAAENDEDVDARAIAGIEGWVECFPKAKLAGTVFAGGVTAAGEVNGHAALEEAFQLGLKA